MASSKTAMPSEPLVSMTPAPPDEQEALLREARDVADRLRLILDINNTIAAHLELEDLLHAVAASLRGALQCDAAAIAVADTQAGSLRYHAVDFPESIGVARPGYVMPIEGTLLGAPFQQREDHRRSERRAQRRARRSERRWSSCKCRPRSPSRSTTRWRGG